MGNRTSRHPGQQQLATVAVAKYLRLAPGQIRRMRSSLLDAAANLPMDDEPALTVMTRAALRRAMAAGGIVDDPDRQVLDLLFTMWSTQEEDRIEKEGLEFVVSLVPLACPDADLRDVLELALELYDVQEHQQLAAAELVAILTSINVTLSYFGDATLTARQIQRVVDDVFGIITFVTTVEGKVLSHQECLSQLEQHDLMQRVALNQLVKTTCRTDDELEGESSETAHDARPENHALTHKSRSLHIPMSEEDADSGIEDYYNSYDDDDEERTEYEATLAYEMPAPFATTRLEDDSDLMTEISSVILTPLTKVQVLASA